MRNTKKISRKFTFAANLTWNYVDIPIKKFFFCERFLKTSYSKFNKVYLKNFEPLLLDGLGLVNLAILLLEPEELFLNCSRGSLAYTHRHYKIEVRGVRGTIHIIKWNSSHEQGVPRYKTLGEYYMSSSIFSYLIP